LQLPRDRMPICRRGGTSLSTKAAAGSSDWSLRTPAVHREPAATVLSRSAFPLATLAARVRPVELANSPKRSTVVVVPSPASRVDKARASHQYAYDSARQIPPATVNCLKKVCSLRLAVS